MRSLPTRRRGKAMLSRCLGPIDTRLRLLSDLGGRVWSISSCFRRPAVGRCSLTVAGRRAQILTPKKPHRKFLSVHKLTPESREVGHGSSACQFIIYVALPYRGTSELPQSSVLTSTYYALRGACQKTKQHGETAHASRRHHGMHPLFSSKKALGCTQHEFLHQQQPEAKARVHGQMHGGHRCRDPVSPLLRRSLLAIFVQ